VGKKENNTTFGTEILNESDNYEKYEWTERCVNTNLI
jgi:hypothetical protein